MLNGDGTVATRLKAARERRGMSQNTLASRSGVSNSTISRIEAGVISSPGVDVLRKLSDTLRVELSEITGERLLSPRRASIFEEVAYVPLMRVRVQASGHPQWDDTHDNVVVSAAIVRGRPNIRAVSVTGWCMEPFVMAGERVVFDPDAHPQNGDMVIVTDDEGATLVKWFRLDPLGRPYLRAADGTEMRPRSAKIEGVVLHVERRGLRDPELGR